jgi:hypothetical protein
LRFHALGDVSRDFRESDNCALKPKCCPNVPVRKDGTIQLRNEKTGAVVYLPVLPPLRQALVDSLKGRPGQLAFTILMRGTNVGEEHLGRGSARPPIEPASSIARRTASARRHLVGSPRPARQSIS